MVENMVFVFAPQLPSLTPFPNLLAYMLYAYIMPSSFMSYIFLKT